MNRLPAGSEAEAVGLTQRKQKRLVEAEEVAWKKVAGDVLRTPVFPNIIACLVGAGA